MRSALRFAGVFVSILAAACGSSDDTATGALPDGGGGSSGGDPIIEPPGPSKPGDVCTSDDTCEGRCTAGACAAPTVTDGKLSPSLGETDVDCGAPTAKPCAIARTCAADPDCTSKVCSPTSRTCVVPSCRGANGASGIDTCGTGEPGAPGAIVESCCKSLPLPVTTTRALDRYEITAGRVRAFVTALAAANGGQANVRKFAKDFAAANTSSELGKVLTKFPGLLDVLPDQSAPDAALPLPVHLGAFPLDPINELDGCFVEAGGFAHATYWQEPASLKPFGVGYPKKDADGVVRPDGVRKLSREQLDAKAMNCVMPIFLAAFCAWDGGELARTSDYREVWGRTPATVGATTVFHPWTELQPIGKFNWRNGHGEACPVAGWPGCQNPQPYFYQFPASGAAPRDDDSPAIGAPGRFPLDVTKAVSANGEGWFDVGGNMMEAAWPNTTDVPLGATPVTNVCDVSAGTGGTACTRRGRAGVVRYTGALPHIALVGYSFEGHARRSEVYLSSVDGAESKLDKGDMKPVTFQYGKIGGRCARVLSP